MVGPVTPRAPLSAFDGERLPGIGHNQGPPLDPARSWRRFAWKTARAALMPKLPLEVVRRRVRRAAELGLEYPAYASILMGTGRDIVGFMFTCDALGMRLVRGLSVDEVPPDVAAKLRGLAGCAKILAARAPADPLRLCQHLSAGPGLIFDAGAALPGRAEVPWAEGRAAIRAALQPLKLPADAVVMVGTDPAERRWADAARLAQFLPAERYFGTPP